MNIRVGSFGENELLQKEEQKQAVIAASEIKQYVAEKVEIQNKKKPVTPEKAPSTPPSYSIHIKDSAPINTQ